MTTQVIMPQLGESVVEGTVSRWLKQEGDAIQEFEPLLEISTDKVDTEIPASADGVLLKIYVQAGQTVERGTLLAVIGAAGEIVGDDSPPVTAQHVLPTHQQPAVNAVPIAYNGQMTPVVARMAAEHQLDLAAINGTGRNGRVTKRDVEDYLERDGIQDDAPTDDTPPWERPGSGDLFKSTVDYEDQPQTETAVTARPTESPLQKSNVDIRVHPVEAIPAGIDGELIPLTAMRRAIANHMVMSKHTSPHVTTVFEIDMSAVLKHREAHKESFAKQGVNLTLTAYFVSAAADALQTVPYLNARWTDDGIYLVNGIHIGVAVALDNGLIVPVIKNVHDLNLLGAARAINDLATRAREKKLKPEEVQGGTFSITNHGVSGSLMAMPIINQPQVGILGIGMMEKRVKVIDDMIAIRPCVYTSLTFDHRVVDGAQGDTFLMTLKRRLEGWV